MTDKQRRTTSAPTMPAPAIPATGLSWRDFFVRLGEGSLPSAANASVTRGTVAPEPADS
ncbi:hypothetical protein [Pararhodobacter aggregans]|uniref:hypothetical protein n=1 Tax=Pararhodobacter aggregans TaxID=404875 RepID=UPI003A95109B